MKNNIGYFQKIKGWSNEELAERASMSTTHLSRLKNDKSDLTGATISKFAAIFGVEPSDIIAPREDSDNTRSSPRRFPHKSADKPQRQPITEQEAEEAASNLVEAFLGGTSHELDENLGSEMVLAVYKEMLRKGVSTLTYDYLNGLYEGLKEKEKEI